MVVPVIAVIRWAVIAVFCVYLPKYSSICAGPPKGALACTFHRIAESFSMVIFKAAASVVINFYRNSKACSFFKKYNLYSFSIFGFRFWKQVIAIGPFLFYPITSDIDTAPANNTVYVRMKTQILSVGMQDAFNARFCAQPFFIGT